jgi:3'(2'), 5'-bisphosphate nucleotidase
LDVARAAATRAGAAILEVYRSGDFATREKSDRSPVTRADETADRLILEALAASGIPCVTEESCPPYETRKSWRRLWLIDPLDGTKDFLAKNDEFTVNIALVEEGRPVLGVVYAPALNLLYDAAQGKGARKNGRPIQNHRQGPGIIAAMSRFHETPESVKWCRENGVTERRKYGSALKFGKLAEGEVDVYPRFAGSKEWDTAAGHCLLLEAGCRIAPGLAYNKPDIHNPHFIAAGPGFTR